MASITIRGIDASTKERLRRRAALHGRSIEAEARSILRAAVAEHEVVGSNLAEAIQRRFRPLGGGELRLAEREPIREAPMPTTGSTS